MIDAPRKRPPHAKRDGMRKLLFERPKTVVEEDIEGLLCASQRPFNSRLEAVLYIFFADDMSQERAQATAKDLADWLCMHMYMDVDREV